MPEDIDVRNRVLGVARERFFRFGFTKVTTEEIASRLGMSKKTLYRYFPSKYELLRGVVEMVMKEIGARVDRLVQDEEMDFVEKIKQLMTFLGMELSRIGQPFLRDLQRSAPEIWKKIDEFRQKKILTHFGNLFNEGVEEGVLRDDINQQLLVLMYANTIQNIINPETLSQLPFSASEAFETIIKVIFEGILTDGARAKYLRSQRS